MEKAFKSLNSITETVLQEAHDHIAIERKALEEAKAMADTTSNAEILRLQQQNALLSRLLESERVKAERAKEDLLQRIAGLLGTFTAERDRSLREAFSEMTESNASAEAGMVKLGKDQGQRIDAVVQKGVEWSSTLDRREGELKRTRDGAFKVSLVHTFVSPLRIHTTADDRQRLNVSARQRVQSQWSCVDFDTYLLY